MGVSGTGQDAVVVAASVAGLAKCHPLQRRNRWHVR
jgi:hypothetical protein